MLGLGEVCGAERPLIFLGDENYPPVSYLENGVAKGIDVDLANALSKPMKREIQVKGMNWNLAQEKVLKGEADGLLGLSFLEERLKYYDFAKPTFIREFGFVVRTGTAAVRDSKDLQGKKVGVTPDGFPRQFIETQPNVTIVFIQNYRDGFVRLTNGTIDVVAADLWTAAYLIGKNGFRGVDIVGKPFAAAPGAIAVKKGNVTLLDQINQAIATLERDGTIKKIQERWQPPEMVSASRARIRSVITSLLGIFLVMLFGTMAVWIFTLRKQLRIRRQAELDLRQSEERFQLAVRGSSDGLWDRNILTNQVFFSDHYRELLGYLPHEFSGAFSTFESILHPDDKAKVLKMVAAHLEHHEPYDAEYRLRTKSGEYRWFRGRGQAIWDEQGRPIRMAGSISDITEHKQTQERINLLQMITMDVATARDLPAAFEIVLQRVCEKTGWALGQAWVPSRTGATLDCCPAWFAQKPTLENFRALSRNTLLPPGAGLPGRVWKSRQPEWVQDVTLDMNFPRADAARKCGLKSGLAVPILCGEEVTAVLEFFLTEVRKEDERLIQVIAAVAAQIGLVIDCKRADQALRKSEELLRAVVEDQTEMIVRWNPDGTRTFANQAYSRSLGRTRDEVIGTAFFPLLNELDRAALLRKICSLTPTHPVATDLRKDMTATEEIRWYEWTDRGLFDSENRLVEIQSTGRDITKRKQAEELIQTQRQTLEMIASGSPAAETLDALLRMIEAQSPSMHCSILLLEPDGVRIRHWAAPSLPADYLKAIDGSAIGPCAGSCGTAAFRREPVFVADIENDPLWVDYKRFALPHGLRACWSTPLLDAQRQVLGTFAIYYHHTGLPEERHQKLIRMATDTAAVCIAKHRADEALRESEERFRAVVEFSPECIAVSVEDRLTYVNPAGARMVGADDPATLVGRSVYDFLPIELHELAKERRRSVMASGVPTPPLVGPMVRLDGAAIFVESIAVPFVYRGQPAILNLIRDITEHKRAEDERTQAVAREQKSLKEFAQQLIASQEAERRRIAGELHDSLGQNLLIIKNRSQLALTGKSISSDSRTQLEAINTLVSQSIFEVREISRDLHPYQIDHLGLTGAIDALIGSTATASEIKFRHKLDMVDECFSPEAAMNLYRIVQESLNNILKHSHATQTDIELERDVHEIRLRIKDDGCGFNESDGNAGKGLGLRNMAERVRLLHGELKVDSQPKQGTRIEVSIPIKEEK